MYLDIYYYHFAAFIILFSVIKAFANALKHDYLKWKQRLGIPDRLDFWFNPAISHNNKNRGKLFWFITWEMITPFSDMWHTLWTLFQFAVTIDMMILFGWWQGLLPNVISVFVVFNGIYNFLRYRKVY